MNQNKELNSNTNDKEVADWASKKEVIHTSIPIYLTLGLIEYAPKFFTNFIVYCVSFGFFIFNKRAKNECRRFQNQFVENSGNSIIKKPRIYKQILAFSITFLEKVECWVKRKSTVKIQFQDDDVYKLIDQLNSGKGAFIITSHLGNAEILRNLANNNNISLKKEVPVAVLMDLESTSNFTNTLEKINPGFTKNIIDVNNVTPATIEILSDVIENGGMVVTAGDRVSKDANSKSIVAEFLGKKAQWSYGVYLIAMLLKAPVYHMFGVREKDTSFNRKYNLHIVKSSVNTECSRKERETKINELCLEFVKELEKVCKLHPFQWYNFYDFWKMPDNQ